MTTHSETLEPPTKRTHVDGDRGLAALRADHAHLDRLAMSVLQAVVAGDRGEAAASIRSMQETVLAHLAEEERKILPAYARHAPEEAAAIMAEHVAIRNAFAEIDVATDLHLLRADSVEAFLASLRAHAEREDRGLYRWYAETGEHVAG